MAGNEAVKGKGQVSRIELVSQSELVSRVELVSQSELVPEAGVSKR